jgi:hypothetical protein
MNVREALVGSSRLERWRGLGGLGNKAQRFKGPHAIDEEHAVQMIVFVLNDSRREIACAKLDSLGMTIQRPNGDLFRPRHQTANAGNAEASFPIFDCIGADGNDLRVDEHHGVADVVVLGAADGNKQSDIHVHLGRGEACAAVLAHRRDHVVDQLLKRRGLDLAAIERSRFLAKHGVAHSRDFQDRHR